MCTKMRIVWTILVFGSLLQGSYAEETTIANTGFVQNTTLQESATTTPLAPSTDSTTAGPTSSQQLTSTFTSPLTPNLISTTQLPIEKDSTTVALTSNTNKVNVIDLTSPQHTTGSTINNTRPDITAITATTATQAETTTETAQKTGIPTTAPESATTTTNAPESSNNSTNTDSKYNVTQEHTSTVPVPTTTVLQQVNSEGSTKPITSGTSYTTTPVTHTSSAMTTSVLTTTPALTTSTIVTTAATTVAAATTAAAAATTTRTTTTTTNALKPKTFNRTIAASRTGDNLERVCAQLMELINATVNCNMVGNEINGDLKFSSITLNVVQPLVEVNKSTDFKQSEDIHMTSIAIMASCGALALFLIAFAVYCSCHRLSYRKNQQHLTEELQTVENGYHDNPTLEVMEVQPEMQEKKLALNGEFNDSWIVPFDLAKDDIPEEEDTHL